MTADWAWLKENQAAIAAGGLAMLVGIGLSRFAYAPLIPALIDAQWFSPVQAAYLGAANLLGYLFGALSAARLTERFGVRAVVGASLTTITLSFLFCAWNLGFYWFFSWRLLAGTCGAILMVVAPSVALSATVPQQRAMVGPIVFGGVGIGAMLSAMVIPLLIEFDLRVTWLLLGLLALLVSVLCDQAMRRLPPLSQAPGVAPSGQWFNPAGLSIVVVLLMVAYALDAIGFLPHTVFWVDFLAREADFGQLAASKQWALFGLGALVGPLLTGLLVRSLGWQRSLCLAFVVKGLAVFLPLLSLALWSQSVSSFLVGALSPGLSALMAGRLMELVGVSAHRRVWGLATAVFATIQAIAAYGMSAFYASSLTYSPLFVVGGLALSMGAALVWASARVGR